MDISVNLNSLDDLKEVENFLFKYIYETPFNLVISVEDQQYTYTTQYNNNAKGYVLITQ